MNEKKWAIWLGIAAISTFVLWAVYAFNDSLFDGRLVCAPFLTIMIWRFAYWGIVDRFKVPYEY